MVSLMCFLFRLDFEVFNNFEDIVINVFRTGRINDDF